MRDRPWLYRLLPVLLLLFAATGGLLVSGATARPTADVAWQVPVPARKEQAPQVTATPTIASGCGPVWQQVPRSELGRLRAVSAISANDIWAVGDHWWGAPVLAHWDGNAWDPFPVPSGLEGYLYGVAAVAPNDVWAVGGPKYSARGAQILHWDGTVWSSVPIPDLQNTFTRLGAVTARAADDVWAVGYTTPYWQESWGQPLALHWNGTAWSATPMPTVAGAQLLGFSAISPNDAWAVGFYSPIAGEYAKRTLILHWDGTAWSQVSGPNYGSQNNQLRAVAAIAADDVWAVGSYSMRGDGKEYTLMQHWDGTT